MKNIARSLLMIPLLLTLLVGSSSATSSTITVKSGDSLFLLARRHGLSIQAIKTANDLKSDTIYVNQRLVIRGASDLSLYTVKAGDSLFLLARRYDTSINAIKAANGLSSDTILAGQSLTLPVTASAPILRAHLTATERDIMARIVHSEAQGEPYSGKVAVAAVIFNRVDNPNFPNTVHGVIYQPWQFEPVLNGWVDKPADPQAYRAVDDALAGNDPSRGSVFFYNPVKAPHAWMATRPVITRIGNHVFMR
jgi:N-acetylmuramoyl-L-alanine amidase